MYTLTKLLYLILIPALLIGGCTAYEAYPLRARAGDSITLAVGSPEGMSRGNTTATFISEADPLNPVDLTPHIRALFKLYADKASQIYDNLFTNAMVLRSGHEPWITMMMIDLPSSLPLGPARIELDTPAIYPGTNSHISNLFAVTQSLVGNGTIDPPIALEILPGTGTAADFPLELGFGGLVSGDLTQLEPQSHVQISPPFVEGNPLAWPMYGAVELTLTIGTNSPLSSATYRLVPDDMSFSTNSHYSLLSNLEGDQLTVVFVSPEGMLQYFEPRFSVVLDSAVQFSPVTDPVTLSSVRYYDLDGHPISGPSALDYRLEIR